MKKYLANILTLLETTNHFSFEANWKGSCCWWWQYWILIGKCLQLEKTSSWGFFVLCNLWHGSPDTSYRNYAPVNLGYLMNAVKAILQRLQLLLMLWALTEDISGVYQNGATEGVLSGSVREEKDWWAPTVGVDLCVKFLTSPVVV